MGTREIVEVSGPFRETCLSLYASHCRERHEYGLLAQAVEAFKLLLFFLMNNFCVQRLFSWRMFRLILLFDIQSRHASYLSARMPPSAAIVLVHAGQSLIHGGQVPGIT